MRHYFNYCLFALLALSAIGLTGSALNRIALAAAGNPPDDFDCAKAVNCSCRAPSPDTKLCAHGQLCMNMDRNQCNEYEYARDRPPRAIEYAVNFGLVPDGCVDVKEYTKCTEEMFNCYYQAYCLYRQGDVPPCTTDPHIRGEMIQMPRKTEVECELRR